jgi:hypothetical protein
LNRKLNISSEEAEALAVRAMLFLAADPERLSRFAGLIGFDAANARAAVQEPGFLAGVLAYLLNDEGTLLAFAENEAIKPVMVPLAFRMIPGGDPTMDINLEAFR